MGIKTKKMSSGGEIGTPDRKKQKARLAQFSDKDNKRVVLAKQQASNGFKGESLNDHGLPDGHVQKDIDTPADSSNAKFRKQKYQDGSKMIKTKPRVDSDATKVAMTEPVNLKKIYGEKLSKLTDIGLAKEVGSNTTGFPNYKLTNKGKQASDSLTARTNRGKFSLGSKSIKTKKMC